MSGSSFTTLASDDRSESVDSIMSGVPLNKNSNMVTKSGSLVMSMSLAQFYLGTEDATGPEDEDFGQDNPFVKELGLDDRAKLTKRSQAIHEAAALASKRAESASSPTGAASERRNPHRGQLDKQLSATQFTIHDVKNGFNKRQDASTKAFKPAILQALEERKSKSDGRAAESDEAPMKSEPKMQVKEKRASLVWRSVKLALGLASSVKKGKKLDNPKHEEHGW